jgi:hypothetical protein
MTPSATVGWPMLRIATDLKILQIEDLDNSVATIMPCCLRLSIACYPGGNSESSHLKGVTSINDSWYGASLRLEMLCRCCFATRQCRQAAEAKSTQMVNLVCIWSRWFIAACLHPGCLVRMFALQLGRGSMQRNQSQRLGQPCTQR